MLSPTCCPPEMNSCRANPVSTPATPGFCCTSSAARKTPTALVSSCSQPCSSGVCCTGPTAGAREGEPALEGGRTDCNTCNACSTAAWRLSGPDPAAAALALNWSGSLGAGWGTAGQGRELGYNIVFDKTKQMRAVDVNTNPFRTQEPQGW